MTTASRSLPSESFDPDRFEQLRSDRLAYVEGLRRNSGFEAGILRLLTQLYPDNAHFIYELLQNAEDAHASHARFILLADQLIFEHDGVRLFTSRDLESITSIGDSSKLDAANAIGKFGVGFKAVFAYTQTPEIYSGEYQFRIHDLVVPEQLPCAKAPKSEFSTRFVFPFNHERKSALDAGAEIANALGALDDATLLFLSNICRISYVLQDGSEGSLERMRLRGHGRGEHVEVVVSDASAGSTSSNWLRFSSAVKIDDDSISKECVVALAFKLEPNEAKGQANNWKVVPLTPGKVCIFFPAEKETSNLRFHMHAPFASTVARDSVRDCLGNHQLIAALAALAAQAMEAVRDLGLLTVAALEVLPLPDDNLSALYAPIRLKLIEAFRSADLVPTKAGSHQRVAAVLKGPADIAALFDDEDIAVLVPGGGAALSWCANPPQVNQRADKFLESLRMKEWGWRELSDAITCTYARRIVARDLPRPARLQQWLEQKEDSWLRRLYALLNEAISRHHCSVDVSDLAIVRVDGGEGVRMLTPRFAFFEATSGSISQVDDVNVVKVQTYASGKSDAQKQAARNFLERIGVRVYDEEVAITSILRKYSASSFPSRKQNIDDVLRFTRFFGVSPSRVGIFRGVQFLLGEDAANAESVFWCTADGLFLDSPIDETGLSALSTLTGKKKLWSGYKNVTAKRAFLEFVKTLGVQSELQIVPASTYQNTMRSELHRDYYQAGVRRTASAVDVDWTVPGIWTLMTAPTVESSRLLWIALIAAKPEVATAKFRPNQKYNVRKQDSQLVQALKVSEWIPDSNGKFRRPEDISRTELLPEFVFDARNGLLSAISFEQSVQRHSAEYARKEDSARELGFHWHGDAMAVADALRDSGLDPKAAAELIRGHSPRVELPLDAVKNVDRRRRGVLESRDNAPEASAVRRERSIQPHVQDVVARAKAYLRPKYTNAAGDLVCQMCVKVMPFRLSSGEFFFEAVQAIHGLERHYYENRLAFCPVCSAMFQYAARTSDNDLCQAIVGFNEDQIADSVAIPIEVGGEPASLHFVGTHFFDLQIVLAQSLKVSL